MRYFWMQPIGLALVLGLLAMNVQADNSHAFSYDLVRQLDTVQDGGQLNLNYQVSTGRRSALVVGIADGDHFQVYELGFKRYNERLLSGTFFQLGASYWRGDDGYDSSAAADVRLGYELPLSRHFVLSGAISANYGAENPWSEDSSDFIFRPHLSLMWHF